MNWISSFFTSSLGKKVIMSLTGLFLILFLVVHLVGNLQLLANDGGEKFNLYTKFMTTNPLIKTISYGLYAFILLHTVQGLILWRQNRSARRTRYAVASTKTSSFAARNMAYLGIVILIFLILHLWQFWFQMKIGSLEMITYSGHEPVKDLYKVVDYAFGQWWYVLFYVVSMFFLAFHLKHGLQSAFQSLGLNHRKYTPIIKWIGSAYSILVPLGFALIPLIIYLSR
ncbi:MAG: succinate dehydrogenase cytochrome b subunit [Saprospiraceae bacterium]|nr:succinate dehydrogenase cytochrome b subunit [Saprospiraceae bacterium]